MNAKILCAHYLHANRHVFSESGALHSSNAILFPHIIYYICVFYLEQRFLDLADLY